MTRPTDERLRRVADGMQADHDEQQAMAAELLALRAEAAEREARAFWRGVTACEAQRADDDAGDFADAFLHHEYYGNDRQADDAIGSSERAHDTATRLRAALASDAGGEAPKPANGRTLFGCRCCDAWTGGNTDGALDAHGWKRIARIDGPNAICPACVADPEALDGLREEYPHAHVVGEGEERGR